MSCFFFDGLLGNEFCYVAKYGGHNFEMSGEEILSVWHSLHELIETSHDSFLAFEERQPDACWETYFQSFLCHDYLIIGDLITKKTRNEPQTSSKHIQGRMRFARVWREISFPAELSKPYNKVDKQILIETSMASKTTNPSQPTIQTTITSLLPNNLQEPTTPKYPRWMNWICSKSQLESDIFEQSFVMLQW